MTEKLEYSRNRREPQFHTANDNIVYCSAICGVELVTFFIHRILQQCAMTWQPLLKNSKVLRERYLLFQ